MTILVLPSCKSHKYCSDALRAVQDSSMLFSVVRTVDTVLVHDSVYIRELQKGDTVFRDRVEYRDRWRTRVVHDTVVDVRVEKEVIQLPPERYVPLFHKWCTRMFWLIVATTIIYILLKFYRKG